MYLLKREKMYSTPAKVKDFMQIFCLILLRIMKAEMTPILTDGETVKSLHPTRFI